MKLPGFPIAQPGELFSSVVARHLERSPGPNSRHLKLLGLLHIAAADTVIPRDLRPFVSMMPSGHPWEAGAEVIAKSSTLVPLFLHFARPERAATILKAIIAGKSKNPAASLGITSGMSRDLQHAGRFCPDCLARDIRTLGFPVLYRQHQPPFVGMCAEHARPLHFNCLRCQSTRNAVGMWRMAGRCKCNDPITPTVLDAALDSKTREGYLWLAMQVATILGVPDPMPKGSRCS